MSISTRTVIISGLTATVVVVALVIIGVAISVNVRNRPGIFKRCDGSPEPLGDIKISSCPDSYLAGYCEIKSDAPVVLEFTFTSAINYYNAKLTAEGPLDKWQDLNACDYGLQCPSKEGAVETLTQVVRSYAFKEGQSGQLKFKIIDEYNASPNEIFCVEFAAKIV